MSILVPVDRARKQLGELIQEAHYGGSQFVLTRNKKPMAALIGTKEFSKMLDLIEKHAPALADTLAIIANPEIQKILEESGRDIAAGRTVPIEGLLK